MFCVAVAFWYQHTALLHRLTWLDSSNADTAASAHTPLLMVLLLLDTGCIDLLKASADYRVQCCHY
jgi:hypothetical protein